MPVYNNPVAESAWCDGRAPQGDEQTHWEASADLRRLPERRPGVSSGAKKVPQVLEE